MIVYGISLLFCFLSFLSVILDLDIGFLWMFLFFFFGLILKIRFDSIFNNTYLFLKL